MEHPDRLVKTSVYLEAHLRDQLNAAAKRRGVSSAALIRIAVESVVERQRPAPQGGFLSGNTPVARTEYD